MANFDISSLQVVLSTCFQHWFSAAAKISHQIGQSSLKDEQCNHIRHIRSRLFISVNARSAVVLDYLCPPGLNFHVPPDNVVHARRAGARITCGLPGGATNVSFLQEVSQVFMSQESSYSWSACTLINMSAAFRGCLLKTETSVSL